MNVIFLDYDGVVNNIIWGPNGERANYMHPSDKKVNDFQAVQWISEFCKKYNYGIVVTSSWIRMTDEWAECLINGGLRDGIQILGCVDPKIDNRSKAIAKYIAEHPEIDKYIIIDDEVVLPTTHLIQCHTSHGFGYGEFIEAENLHASLDGYYYDNDVLACDTFADGIVLHLRNTKKVSIKYKDLIDIYCANTKD